MKQEKGKQTYSSHAAHMPILLRCRFRPLGTQQLVSFIGFNHHDACTGATAACFGSRKTTSGKSRHNIFEINFSLKYGTRRIDRIAQSGSRFGLRGHCLEVFIQSANFVSNQWSGQWHSWSCQVSFLIEYLTQTFKLFFLGIFTITMIVIFLSIPKRRNMGFYSTNYPGIHLWSTGTKNLPPLERIFWSDFLLKCIVWDMILWLHLTWQEQLTW